MERAASRTRSATALAAQPITPLPAPLHAPAASPQPAPRRRRSPPAAAASPVAASPSPAFQLLLDQHEGQDGSPASGAGPLDGEQAAAAPKPAKRRRGPRPSAAAAAAAAAAATLPADLDTAIEPVLPLAAADPQAAPAAAEDAAPADGRRTRPRRTSARQAAAAQAKAASAASQAEEAEEEEDEEEGEEEPQKKKRGGRRRAPQAPPIQEVPSQALLERLRAEGYTPPPLPVPNLGYACLNMELRELKPPVFTSRDCIKRTLDAKGLPHLGELCLANCRDLLTIIQWNHEHGIRLFRISSVICPWMGTCQLDQLPQYEEIKSTLRLAGDLARTYGQRLTFHPSHFVKLGAPDDDLAAKSIRELEAHSQIMDLLGFEPSPRNKINIHVGGVYSQLGSKEDTMRRWADNYAKLSPACRARLTVENDDRPGSFSLHDLLFLHNLTGVPLVFDFHHHKAGSACAVLLAWVGLGWVVRVQSARAICHLWLVCHPLCCNGNTCNTLHHPLCWKKRTCNTLQFCTGGLSEREAFEAAIRTWPQGVRPVCHWSESQAGRKPHAHSGYVRGPLTLHGWEDQVDVMIEAKCKERALLGLRGDIPIPEDPPVDFEEAPLGTEEAVALRLL